MTSKLRRIALTIVAAFVMGAPAMVSASVYALDNTSIRQGLNCGSDLNLTTAENNACTETDANANFSSLLKKIINIFSVIVGVIAVIMIIIGGLKYITSGGESSNVSGAKNTIIYAIVGLVVVALAQFIVHFVLNNVNTV